MRNEKRVRDRAQRRNVRRERRVAIWAIAAIIVVAGVFVTTRAAGAQHPKPRSDAHAGHVVPADRYDGHPRIAQVYAQAAEIPATLDGIYCYCQCEDHSGHYSLLDCFKSDHAARCDICLSEAALAHRMVQEGKTLDQIRAAIDGIYAR